MCRLIVGRPNLEVETKRLASPSAGKNTGVVLVPCRTWRCVPTANSNGVDISEARGCNLLWQMSSQWGQWGSQKLLQGLLSHKLTAYLSVFNLFLTQWIMATLSKVWKPDNAWSCSLCEGRTSFFTRLISKKHCGFLLMFSIGSTSLSVSLHFPLSITFFVFILGFWFYFI